MHGCASFLFRQQSPLFWAVRPFQVVARLDLCVNAWTETVIGANLNSMLVETE